MNLISFGSQIIGSAISFNKQRTDDLISTIQVSVGEPLNIKIKYVESFPNYKFEEFVSLVK